MSQNESVKSSPCANCEQARRLQADGMPCQNGSVSVCSYLELQSRVRALEAQLAEVRVKHNDALWEAQTYHEALLKYEERERVLVEALEDLKGTFQDGYYVNNAVDDVEVQGLPKKGEDGWDYFPCSMVIWVKKKVGELRQIKPFIPSKWPCSGGLILEVY